MTQLNGRFIKLISFTLSHFNKVVTIFFFSFLFSLSIGYEQQHTKKIKQLTDEKKKKNTAHFLLRHTFHYSAREKEKKKIITKAVVIVKFTHLVPVIVYARNGSKHILFSRLSKYEFFFFCWLFKQ